MKAISASSHAADAYRAGLEIGKVLAAINPEVVILFATIHYAESNELTEAIYDAIDNENLILIGNTGDGYYETHGASDHGVAAVGLNSEGAVTWSVNYEEGIREAPAQVTERLLNRTLKTLGTTPPELLLLLSDFKTDASQIEKIVESIEGIPIVGGLAADDNLMADCALFVNKQCLRNAAATLAIQGEINFNISIGNNLTPVGKQGRIDAAEGASIFEIAGCSAMDFIEQETGKPVLQSDRGLTSLTIIDPDQPFIKRLRSIVPDFSTTERSLGLYGGIEQGKSVQVCVAQPQELIAEVYQIAKRHKEHGFEPSAAIIISCAGRKSLLGEDVNHEIKALSEQFGITFPIVGFPSFGEIGPLKNAEGYTRNLFHNMTYVLLLLGK
ncbi:MAG: FIST C-terminal domain-containing protein [Hahellaceae bacterium]|nr:FIST C-terminal domain-containing protein [Hahellaceae bacterium]